MPVYEYQCKSCDIIVDQLVSIKKSDSHKVICDCCGKLMKKKISTPKFYVKAGKVGNYDNGYSDTNAPKIK